MQEENKALKTSSPDWIGLFVTFFGLGRIPKAPGTFGSLGAFPLIFLLAWWGPEAYITVTTLFLALSLWATAIYLRQNPSNQDPKEVVVDEVVGMLATFFLVPLTPVNVLIGFLLFRFFDILKPFPISIFDKKVPGSAGVMADDIVAGFIASMIFHFILIPKGWI